MNDNQAPKVPRATPEGSGERRWTLTHDGKGWYSVCVGSQGLACARPSEPHVEVVEAAALDALAAKLAELQAVYDEHTGATDCLRFLAALDKATRERDEALGLLRKLRGCNPLSQDAKNSFIDALLSRLAAPETKE